MTMKGPQKMLRKIVKKHYKHTHHRCKTTKNPSFFKGSVLNQLLAVGNKGPLKNTSTFRVCNRIAKKSNILIWLQARRGKKSVRGGNKWQLNLPS